MAFTDIPDVPLYSGDAPNRNTQEQAEFSANSDDSLQYQATLADNLNTTTAAINVVADEIQVVADEAQASADTAASNANYKGKWVDQTGAANIPYSVSHNGSNWQLLSNIADITLSEPSDINGDWLVIIGASFVTENAILHDTLAGAKSRTDVVEGSQIEISDRDEGNFVCVTGETANTFDIINHDTLSLQLKLIDKDGEIRVAQYGLNSADPIATQTGAINAATDRLNELNGGVSLIFLKGNFEYLGSWVPIELGTNDVKIIGAGSGDGGTEIKFDYVSGESDSVDWNAAFFGLTISGIHFRGQGKTVLNPNASVQRCMTDLNATTASYGTRVSDVQISDFSGDGARIARWFQQRWDGCYAKRMGQDGYVLSGDQSIRWTGSGGSFFDDIGTDGDQSIRRFALWIKSGKPVIQNPNFGPCNNMIKLGEGPSSPCRARIYNANLEWIRDNGVGILVTENSQIIDSEDILGWGPFVSGGTSTEDAKAIVQFEKLWGRNVVRGVAPSFVSAEPAFGGFDNMILIDSADIASVPYLVTERSIDDEFTFRAGAIKFVQGPASATQYARGIAGDVFFDKEVDAKGFTNKGVLDVTPLFWVRSVDGTNINLDNFGGGALPDISSYVINPDTGQVTVSLPSPGSFIGKPITFTNMTDGTFNFRLNTAGATLIDGVDGVTYTEPYASVTIMAVDSNNWIELARKV